ncbi:PQQ-binding-like beta-propeller repeat protein [Haloferula chungangensis]|uniref:PQQ-binding-like beta-propeller repeat protein n=1 Tax=Haloferula chungangensis TaxID=1048331 RepID=A0ABW2L5K9_9BACT
MMLLFDHLGVVPIVVNAGAALLPAMLAGAASFVALLFKPRELLAACKARPARVAAIVGIIALVTAVIVFWPAPATDSDARSARRGGAAGEEPSGGALAPVTVDWTRVALARIEAMKRGDLSSAPVANTPSQSEDQAFVFRGGLERMGSNGADIEGPLTLAWSYYPKWSDNGVEQEDRDAMILSSPAIYGDRVYGASCTLDPPDSFGAIFCLDAATGKQHWTVDKADGELFKGFFSSPAISADGKYLVVGQGLHPDSNCRLICVETATGRVVWTYQVELHIESSPFIDGDVVYVGAGAIEDPETHKPTSHPGFVFAVSLTDGKLLWRQDVNDPESSPAVRDGKLFIGSGFNGQAIVALDASTDAKERILWKTDTPYPITGAVTLMDDLVIAGGGNGDFVYRDPNPAGVVLALNASDGSEKWKTTLPDAVLGAVAAADKFICPVANGEVIALDPANGERLWSTAISNNAPVLGSAAVTEKSVYAVSQNGYLARLHLADGKEVERVYLNSTDKPGEQGLCISSPIVWNGRLFVGSETGGIRCYVGGQSK